MPGPRRTIVAIVMTSAACTPSPSAPSAPSALDAGVTAPSADPRTALGEVNVSFLTREGGYWGPVYALVPDPASLVQPCYAKALELRGSTVGWAFYELAPARGGVANATVRFVESSPLPEPLVTCMSEALARLRVAESGLELPLSLAYVTLR